MALPPLSAPGIAMLAPRGIEGEQVSLRGMEGAGRLEEPSAFEALFQEAVGKTNSALVHAEKAAKDFASGASDDIHGTMIAVSEADIQLRLVGSMRNRIIEAFNEIWRMQV